MQAVILIFSIGSFTEYDLGIGFKCSVVTEMNSRRGPLGIINKSGNCVSASGLLLLQFCADVDDLQRINLILCDF
jgi:hypothetical protein